MQNVQPSLRSQLVRKIEARDELFLRQARDGNFKSYCLYMDYNFFARRAVLKGRLRCFLTKGKGYMIAFRDGKPIKVAILAS